MDLSTSKWSSQPARSSCDIDSTDPTKVTLSLGAVMELELGPDPGGWDGVTGELRGSAAVN
jgi:hypothetical protein